MSCRVFVSIATEGCHECNNLYRERCNDGRASGGHVYTEASCIICCERSCSSFIYCQSESHDALALSATSCCTGPCLIDWLVHVYSGRSRQCSVSTRSSGCVCQFIRWPT